MQQKAIEWAQELMASEASTRRTSIVDYEVLRERLVHSRFQRGQVYRLELDLWEPVGLARLELGRVDFPADRVGPIVAKVAVVIGGTEPVVRASVQVGRH
ncbi:MAG: hypothetical protein JKY65_13645, partial [Planctomycetes bacterium]|nr:hypothetical protein [Planctomycetota bacterium]